MAYTVLARKYRSRTFEEVIGQEPIATTLVNGIAAGRIAHGFLFTGTRGVGKTSMARILAKALNCQNAEEPTTKPCCECDACLRIAEGHDVDVLEIDAASHTGVDNIRELRSNTAYKPARSRFKVYIIDEVHMLSTGAFNALLKTLEEPPEHVKFILATTELQKVPATIQSRCQCFSFRNIGPEPIADRLAQIIAAEGAEADEAVVRRVARLANGSMRDALSILDQLLSATSGRLTAAALDELLPPAQDERVFSVLQRAASGEVPQMLAELDGLLAGGRGLEMFCHDAIEIVRALMLVRTCGADSLLVDVPADARDDYLALSQQFELSHYVQMIAMLEELRRNVRYSGAGRALTEALLVRCAKLREWGAIEELIATLPADDSTPAASRARSASECAVPPADEKKKYPPAARPADVAAADRGTNGCRVPESEFQRRDQAGVPHTAAGRADVDGAAQDATVPEVPAGWHPSSEPGATPTAVSDAEAQGHDATRDLVAGDAGREASPAGRVQRDLSMEERRRIEQDPVVRQAIELFDGTLIRVERCEPTPVTEPADDEDME